jgi:peptidoglycan/xylan/chitin deacetylase (PgdA/CDA1 family)
MSDGNKSKGSLAEAVRFHLRRYPGVPNTFGSERSFDLPIGVHWEPDRPRGYYIDFSLKVPDPRWPPFWLPPVERQLFVGAVQWALGALERYLHGDGDAYLEAAHQAAEYLLENQHREGSQEGGWRQLMWMPHTFRIAPPWISGITQGEGASFLARLHTHGGDDRYAEAALRALEPMTVPVAEGGVLASLEGSPIVEEYPTEPPSCVLNGAIFALWGFYDVHKLLGDDDAGASFERLTDALASNLWRYDTGYWSRYDLYPHPIANVASPAYHLLHVKQLQVLNQLAPMPELEQAAERFDAYRSSSLRRRRAVGHKIAFRLVVPRNPVLAHRLPWNRAARRADSEPARTDTVVLSYHAVSPDWDSPLSVTPEQLADQIEYMLGKGYKAVTFSEAVGDAPVEKALAITFDDGCHSVFDRAAPILERFGVPGTLFVATDYIGRGQPMSWPGIDQWVGGPHEHELLPMSWEQAQALADAGWEIGSHTRSHPLLTEVSEDQLSEELAGSRGECERRLGRPCTSIAYPYGDYDERVVAAAATAGYSAGCTLPADLQEPSSALTFPRIGIFNVDDGRSFRLKVSPLVRRMRRSGAWQPAMTAVRAITGRQVDESSPAARR